MPQSTVLSRILRNISWLVSERVVLMLTSLGVTILLARLLTPSLYGSLSVVQSLVAMLAPVTALGLNAIIIRELSEQKNDSRVMTTALAFRLIGAMIGVVVMIGVAVLWGELNDAEQLGVIILAMGHGFFALNGVEFWFQAKVQSRTIARLRMTVMLISAGTKVGVAWQTQSIVWVLAVFAAEVTLIGLGMVWLLCRHKVNVALSNIDWAYGRGLLKQSFWLILSGIASVIYLKIDQIMLADMTTREIVGHYAVAVRLSEVWYFFATAVVASAFSTLLALRESNPTQYRHRLQQISDVLLTAALLLAVGVMLLAPVLVPLLFGDAYAPSAGILIIHIWAGVFVFMRALVSKWLIAEHLLPFSLVSHGLGALFNVALNLWLIPKMGAYGAAIATVVSYAAAGYLAFWVHPKTREIALIMTRSLILPLTLWSRYWRGLQR